MKRLALAWLLSAPLAADELVIDTGEVAQGVLPVELSWSASWRDAKGRDGVWLFAKLRGPAGWVTCQIRAAQVVGGPLEASASRDGRGVYVLRSSEGRGDVAGRLRLSVDVPVGAEIQVHGLELVHVDPTDGPPCWLAKYEVQQGMYARFLDALAAQATFRRAPLGGRTYGGPQGTLRREGGRYVAGRPTAGCGFVGWEDACAFADWAGLRPPRADELRAVNPTGGLWEPALEGPRLALSHGDGVLTRDGRATNTDWSATGRDVVLLGAAGEPPRYPVSDRRAEVGFRPARTAPGVRSVLVLGTDALAALPVGLAELARASGVPRPARVTLRARAGDRFERMASSTSLLEELASGRFEVVVLQEDLTVLGGARRSPQHARPLVEAARAGGATPILVMTWGLHDRPSVAFETAAANVNAWASELGVLVAPFGLSWRRAVARDATLRLHDEAGRNPATAGAWLNACVLHQLLYGELPEVGDADLARVAAQVMREYVQPR